MTAISKNTVNLLQPELFPEAPLLTLSRVVVIWIATLVLMIVWAVITHMNYSDSAQKYAGLSQENKKVLSTSQALEAKLTNRKISTELVNRLNTLQLVMQHKDALHSKLTDSNETFAGGFVMAMNDLSAMHHKDIRLQTISINFADMSFTGVARNPQAVPAWLAGFQKSRLLSGKSFGQFKLSQNEQGITEFVVSTVAIEGEN